MHGPDVFISYAREDEGMARRFAEAFAQEGLTVWWDAALHSGETFDEVIEQELRASKAVVVLWSPHSVASRWVRAEATLADRNRTLAPAIIAPCNRPIIFELTHTADLSQWQGDIADARWKSFVKDIKRMVATGRAKDAAAVSEAHGHTGDAYSAPAPTAAKPAPASAAGGQNVESLLSAVAALQEAIMKQGGQQQPAPAVVPPPAPPPPAPEPAPEPQAPQTTVTAASQPAYEEDDDDSDATQFYTQGAAYSLMNEEVHCLEVSVDGELAQRHIVTPLGLKIGRVAPADIVLADSKVSRSHCMVELNEDQLFVADLNSTNGTYIDGQRVAGAAILPVGSTLTVGHFSLVHELRNRMDIS